MTKRVREALRLASEWERRGVTPDVVSSLRVAVEEAMDRHIWLAEEAARAKRSLEAALDDLAAAEYALAVTANRQRQAAQEEGR